MHKKNFFSISIFVLSTMSVSGAIPVGYYSNMEGKTTADLKTAAFLDIKTHTSLKYADMWTYFPQTDFLPATPTEIWDMYSNNIVLFTAHSSIDKEHCVPNSWWGGPNVDNEYAYGDLMNLYPANNSINRSKGNNPLSEVGATTPAGNNGVSKSGTSITLGYSGSGFEPADEYKGDFARTYFYMATCYQNYTTWLSDNTGEYEITGGVYPSFQPWAIPLLMKWDREDPVSEKEIQRNETVYKLQNNRNPFIDYPQLAEYIWGNMKDSVWSFAKVTGLQQPVKRKLSISPNPAVNKINLSFDGNGEPIQYSIYSMTGSLVLSGSTTDHTLSIADLKSGVYTCVVITGMEKLVGKVVVCSGSN
jgi:endonuclease I